MIRKIAYSFRRRTPLFSGRGFLRSAGRAGSSKPLRGRLSLTPIVSFHCFIPLLMVSSYRLAGRYLLPDKVKEERKIP